MNRPLLASELSLARWMLEHGEPVARAFLEQLPAAEVTPWGCPCGCASINFQIKGSQLAPPGLHILGDFIFGPEDQLAGIFISESGIVKRHRSLRTYGLACDAP